MAKIIIDSKEVDVPPETTLLQACEHVGVEIPRFCYHERLSIAGNCRMCLVEVKGAPPKPVASCAMRVRDLRPGPNGEPPEIFTKSPMVRKARKGVMEFLLVNHPLDCPICDQGGECDLQDQAMGFGMDTSRFAENKRAVEDKYIGPLVKTCMTRCIHCTRCVRFTQEVAGTAEMGAIGRGEDTEITTYLESAMESELQGNVVDLCPVGALLSRPYSFQARSWELTHTPSIDVMDALGSSIRIDTRGPEVLRILPRTNEAVNEEWISDKTRHIVDGLKMQRLDRPYIRQDGKLRPTSWSHAFETIVRHLHDTDPREIGAIVGDLAGLEEMFALKLMMRYIQCPHLDCRQNGAHLHPAFGRASYLFNTGVAGIEQADALVLVGTHPRLEAPVLNARIRKRWRLGNFPIISIGPDVDHTYPVTHIGRGPDAFDRIASYLKGAQRPMMILGQSALTRADGKEILSRAARIALDLGMVGRDWNGFNVLHTAAACVGGLEIGCVPAKGGLSASSIIKQDVMKLIFNLGADECEIEPGAFVIYIGSHGDRGAHRADLILPGAAYTEKSATYLNMEGRIQRTQRATPPPGEAKEDWAIFRALSEYFPESLPFDTLAQLRHQLETAYPHLSNLGEVLPASWEDLQTIAGDGGWISQTPFKPAIADFYLTNPIARASKVMAECSALKLERKHA